MNVALPLDCMTISDKLRTMEVLWDDLCRRSDDLQSPQWHSDILAERDCRVEEGKEEIYEWDEAKDKIRRSLR
jgi:hypothetical protein